MNTHKKRNAARARLAFWSSIISLVLGWGLTIAGFVTDPTGQVHDSVLWILGQALLYSGAVIGISEHYKGEVTKFKQKVSDKLGIDNPDGEEDDEEE